MKMDGNPGGLRRLFTLVAIRNKLKASGAGGIAYGGFALFAGISDFSFDIFVLLYTGLATVMIIEGILIFLKPSRFGLLVDGAVFFIIAIWNIYSLFPFEIKNLPETGFFLFISLLMFYFGIKHFRFFSLFKDLPKNIPSDMSLKDAEKFVNSILKGAPIVTPELISFNKWGREWRGKLSDDAVLIVGDYYLFAAREEFSYTVNKESAKSVRATLKVNNIKIKANFYDKKYFDRLREWKEGTLPDSAG